MCIDINTKETTMADQPTFALVYGTVDLDWDQAGNATKTIDTWHLPDITHPDTDLPAWPNRPVTADEVDIARSWATKHIEWSGDYLVTGWTVDLLNGRHLPTLTRLRHTVVFSWAAGEESTAYDAEDMRQVRQMVDTLTDPDGVIELKYSAEQRERTGWKDSVLMRTFVPVRNIAALTHRAIAEPIIPV